MTALLLGLILALAPPGASGTPLVSGTASWFRSPADVSAAGPALRRWLGPGWRGTHLRACAGDRCVLTVVADWCRCPDRLIDLDDDAFARLAPLAVGVIAVEVELLRPPETDADG